MKAVWNDVVLAQSDDTVVVEGNHYFPVTALNSQFFRASTHTSVCGWKGTAQYYDVVVNQSVNANAAWYYADPLPAAANIRGRVAFWKGVKVGA